MRTFIIILLLAPLFKLKADIPNFDVIEYKNNEKSIYLKTWSLGILMNNDLCYYSWDGEYISEVSTFINDKILEGDSITIYTEIAIIDHTKISGMVDRDSDSILYHLKYPKRISIEDLNNEYQINSAFRGNTAGYAYSSDLKTADNTWINDYEIEKLFDLTDYELCSFSFYGIKNNLDKKEKAKIKSKLDSILKRHSLEAFESELSLLYKRNIIMIGFCSC